MIKLLFLKHFLTKFQKASLKSQKLNKHNDVHITMLPVYQNSLKYSMLMLGPIKIDTPGNMLRIHYLFNFWTLHKVFKNSSFEGPVFSWLYITEVMLNVPPIRYHKSCSHWNLSLFWQGGQGQETKEHDYILLVSQLLLFLL